MQLIKIGDWELDVTEGEEPRVHDIEIGRFVGLKDTRDVRRIVERNWEELTAHGEIRVSGMKPETSGGRPSTDYWLNEAQAIAVVAHMRTPLARKLRVALVKTFVAFRKGQAEAAAVTPQAIRLDHAHGPRLRDVPPVREEMKQLCAMAGRASNRSTQAVQGFFRRWYGVPSVYAISLHLWQEAKELVIRLANDPDHLALPPPRTEKPKPTPPRDRRQLNMFGPN